MLAVWPLCPVGLLCWPEGCFAPKGCFAGRRAAFLARGLLCPEGLLRWPEGRFSPKGCFAGQGAASPIRLLRWLAGGIAGRRL